MLHNGITQSIKNTNLWVAQFKLPLPSGQYTFTGLEKKEHPMDLLLAYNVKQTIIIHVSSKSTTQPKYIPLLSESLKQYRRSVEL
ncbi:hypothetical protein OIU74_010271 [Salix koriyanagi]|uniref:Uncharacterized protein n=1 Tax=Salix koriyanagi TaxID=2511006 RepID=A0A9Q0QM80_9ROSI|nr:hypothetical protein OIU74_010271 [Salix koriyanagi]